MGSSSSSNIPPGSFDDKGHPHGTVEVWNDGGKNSVFMGPPPPGNGFGGMITITHSLGK